MIKSILYYLLTAVLIFALFKAVKYFYLKPSISIGAQAPDFSFIEQSGNSFSLYKLKGKYVILQFWGSWCGPCRRENAELSQLYSELYKSQKQNSFEIVSIGIESDQNRWARTILNDGMKWEHHNSEFLMFDAKIAKLYGVKQIPTTFILDPDMKLIGINWPIEQLQSFLSDHRVN